MCFQADLNALVNRVRKDHGLPPLDETIEEEPLEPSSEKKEAQDKAIDVADEVAEQLAKTELVDSKEPESSQT